MVMTRPLQGRGGGSIPLEPIARCPSILQGVYTLDSIEPHTYLRWIAYVRGTFDTYTVRLPLETVMTTTVDELRNEIRDAVGRFERVESTAFTKESLAAVCDAVGYDIGTSTLPSKPQMRAGILSAIGVLEDDDPDHADRPFRKAELDAIASALRSE